MARAQVPAGPEFRVNTTTGGTQFVQGHSIATTPSGDFVVVWATVPPVWHISGQRFDAAGTLRGVEFRVNTYVTNRQHSAVVSVLGDAGDFVVAWNSYGQDGSLYGVFAQRYDAAGVPQGTEFRVNTYTTRNQFVNGIAADALGNFVVAWYSDEQDGHGRGVFAQRYDRMATPVGAEFRVNTHTSGFQDSPSVDFDDKGQFVIVWRSDWQDGSSLGIFGQRYDAAGLPLGSEFGVNTFTTGAQSRSVVAADRDGSFVVAWQSASQDGDSWGVFAQRFNAAGSPDGPEFQVNTTTLRAQVYPGIDSDSHGNFTVTWASNYDVKARRFTASGAPRGLEFAVNTYDGDFQTNPGVAVDSVGNFVVDWASYGQDGNNWGVFAQRFGGLRPAALRVDTTGNGALEPGDAGDVRPTWRNQNGAAQVFGGILSTPDGPPGGIPQIVDATADYGTVPDGATEECTECFTVMVTNFSPRPVLHWDTTVLETIVPDAHGQQKTWLLHVGDSFTDVPRASPFYRFIETLLHHGVTSGCSAAQYCPASTTTRDEMAVFVLVAKAGPGYIPPACTTPVFADVPASNPFCPWIEELARRGVVSGCGGGNYCPSSAVSREQMAVFVLRTLDPTLTPPSCTTPIYNDVPASSPFCPWIEELTRRGVVSGCGGGNYCPAAAVTREEMGVFISATFGLTLYGP